MDPQATISHLLGVLCSQAESLRKRTRVDSICSCDFYIRNIPSVLRSWSSLVCILLRVELVGLFRLKFNGVLRLLRLCVLRRENFIRLHLRWFVLTLLRSSLLVLAKPEELGEFACSFPHKEQSLHILEATFSQSAAFYRVLIIREGLRANINCQSL